MAALVTLTRTWRSNTLSFARKLKLLKALVIFTLLYASEILALLPESKQRLQTFETECMRKLLRISYIEHKTSDWVRRKINFLVDPQEPLVTTDRRWKLTRFGHVSRHDRQLVSQLVGALSQRVTSRLTAFPKHPL